MVRVDGVGSSWIYITWTAVDNYPAIQDYQLEYRLTAVPSIAPLQRNNMPSISGSANITMLYPSAMYSVRVRARSPRGTGEYSPGVMATTLKGIPQDGLVSGPEGVVRSIFMSPNNVTISWTVPEVSCM